MSESLDKGSTLVEGKIVINENKKEMDKDKSYEKVTMEVIQEVANGIDPMIQLTIETPCSFKNRKLPVLDVQVNINKSEQNRVDFEFFEKATKHPKLF